MNLTCLVDNTVAHRGEFWGEHGLSILIETPQARILWDTGASGTVLAHNLHLLRFDPAWLDAVALSHAHQDHTGGLPALVGRTRRIPLFAHADLFRPRFRRMETGYRHVGLPAGSEGLGEWFDLRLGTEPVEIAPGVWASGEIRERSAPEGRSPHHFVQGDGGYTPDPYRDDLALVLKAEEGWVVVCGCCHAGLVNTLRHVERTFGGPIWGIVGGAHLIEADDAHLEEAVRFLTDLSVPHLWLNHCTGQRALCRLVQALGDRVQPFPVGTRLELSL